MPHSWSVLAAPSPKTNWIFAPSENSSFLSCAMCPSKKKAKLKQLISYTGGRHFDKRPFHSFFEENYFRLRFPNDSNYSSLIYYQCEWNVFQLNGLLVEHKRHFKMTAETLRSCDPAILTSQNRVAYRKNNLVIATGKRGPRNPKDNVKHVNKPNITCWLKGVRVC